MTPGELSSEGAADLSCWSCGRGVPRSTFESRAILHARRVEQGGPYRSFRCPACRELWVCYRGEENAVVVVVPPDGKFVLDTVLSWFDPEMRRRLKKIKDWTQRNAKRAKTAAHAAFEEARRSTESEAGREDRAPEDPRLDGFRKVLGVGPGASLREIQRAFRRRAKECHPDRQWAAGPEAVEAARQDFESLKKAYEGLRAHHETEGKDQS